MTKTKLSAKWTIDIQKDDNPTHGIDLENELAKILQQEIDNEILIETFVESGWTKVILKELPTFEDSGSIAYWLGENCKGMYKSFPHNIYLFEDSKDAELFILRWA